MEHTVNYEEIPLRLAGKRIDEIASSMTGNPKDIKQVVFLVEDAKLFWKIRRAIWDMCKELFCRYTIKPEGSKCFSLIHQALNLELKLWFYTKDEFEVQVTNYTQYFEVYDD